MSDLAAFVGWLHDADLGSLPVPGYLPWLRQQLGHDGQDVFEVDPPLCPGNGLWRFDQPHHSKTAKSVPDRYATSPDLTPSSGWRGVSKTAVQTYISVFSEEGVWCDFVCCLVLVDLRRTKSGPRTPRWLSGEKLATLCCNTRLGTKGAEPFTAIAGGAAWLSSHFIFVPQFVSRIEPASPTKSLLHH